MFGINLGEFGIIAVIALIVIGPERLPRYAETLGRLVREGRKMALGLREQVREEIGPEFDDVDWRKLDPRQYDPRRIVKEALADTFDDVVPTKPTSATPAAAAGGVAGGTVGGGAKSVGGAAAPGGPDLTKRAAGGTGGADAGAATAAPAPSAAPFDDDAT